MTQDAFAFSSVRESVSPLNEEDIIVEKIHIHFGSKDKALNHVKSFTCNIMKDNFVYANSYNVMTNNSIYEFYVARILWITCGSLRRPRILGQQWREQLGMGLVKGSSRAPSKSWCCESTAETRLNCLRLGRPSPDGARY